MTFNKCYIAVITGACGGIGEEVARLLAKEGISLALLDNKLQTLKSLVAELNNVHTQPIMGFTVDVTDDRCVAEVFAVLTRQLGPVGYLVNAAGVLCYSTVAETSSKDWEKTFAVNTTGVFNVSRHAANLMTKQRKGSIVTIASNAARVPRATMAAYCASKAAAQAFTYALGLEVAPYGVRCNVVAPGSTDTSMLRGMWNNERDQQNTLNGNPLQFRIGIPLNKIATAKEIASAVCFYLCEESGQTTLSTLLVDGGAALGNC
ncbi:2,3-dihydro-2,3-dihydroxybenzoate dehydrogenase [Xenorhabdus poinarii G6]|uniref:2,3-dihydro-2,3-dihydroxybenzoate dehydrogenase n=1 Tax=Xenorhabdus poinarii G6 TaxID=1354304 RepID=A0A068R416_9GAMM|nr:2,3-dihydro-2,3-dihydroxybenzoate dehydrogenase [Xenorhabdus poinarii]CDG21948.1 2,3-dihydro-2,3-dihydroxybenzoate dehydrogenase [Xenorhabdus poinarii G6]